MRAVLERLLAAFASGDDRRAARDLLAASTTRLAGRLGDEAHLAHLFGNAAWSPLLGHRSARIDEMRRIDDAVRAVVRVDAADGLTVRYLASFRREDLAADRGLDEGDPSSGWRLTGLVREELAGT